MQLWESGHCLIGSSSHWGVGDFRFVICELGRLPAGKGKSWRWRVHRLARGADGKNQQSAPTTNSIPISMWQVVRSVCCALPTSRGPGVPCRAAPSSWVPARQTYWLMTRFRGRRNYLPDRLRSMRHTHRMSRILRGHRCRRRMCRSNRRGRSSCCWAQFRLPSR